MAANMTVGQNANGDVQAPQTFTSPITLAITPGSAGSAAFTTANVVMPPVTGFGIRATGAGNVSVTGVSADGPINPVQVNIT